MAMLGKDWTWNSKFELGWLDFKLDLALDSNPFRLTSSTHLRLDRSF